MPPKLTGNDLNEIANGIIAQNESANGGFQLDDDFVKWQEENPDIVKERQAESDRDRANSMSWDLFQFLSDIDRYEKIGENEDGSLYRMKVSDKEKQLYKKDGIEIEDKHVFLHNSVEEFVLKSLQNTK